MPNTQHYSPADHRSVCQRTSSLLRGGALLAALAATLPAQSAHATSSSGLDTPVGVASLPIAVGGVAGLTLNANADPTQPPTVTFSGPIIEGNSIFTTNGYVGIGTMSPTYGLEVSGDFSSSAPLGVINKDSSSTTAAAFSSPSNSGSYILFENGSQTTKPPEIGATGNDFVVQLADPDAPTGWRGDMIVKQSGQVGIGTAQPQGTLDIENGSNTADLCMNGKCIQSLAPEIQVMTRLLPFTVANAQYVDCPSGYQAIACNSVVTPSGSFTCIATPDISDPATSLNACAQAGCSSHAPGDTGYWTTATCMKF